MAFWLVLVVLVLRAPGFAVGIANIDECDFALFGRMVKAGAVPYLGVADIKPPLTYVAYHFAEVLAGGPSFPAIRILGIASILATALLLRAAARTWLGDDRAGWAAAWLSVLAICCESPAVNAEILMNVPVAAALLFFVRGERSRSAWWDLACGVAIGIAALVKHQAGITLVALGLVHLATLALRKGERGHALARGLALGAGFLGAWVAAGLVAAANDWPAFYYWVVTRNLHQVAIARTSSFVRGSTAIVEVLALTALPWVLAVRSALRQRDRIATALALLLALTWIPVSMGGRFYEHYFLQFAPPLALLGASAAVRVLEAWPSLGAWHRRAWAFFVLAPVLGVLGYNSARAVLRDYPAQDPKVRAIASWLRANTSPEDRVFLWGDYSVIYCLADRLPGTRYMRTAPHIGDFDPGQIAPGESVPVFRSERDIAQTLTDLSANRPRVVVDTSTADLHGWSRFPLARVHELEAYVRDGYDLVAQPGGASIYLRRSPTAARGSSSP
jgi:hypothetical protein